MPITPEMVQSGEIKIAQEAIQEAVSPVTTKVETPKVESWDEVFKREFPEYENTDKLKSSLNEYKGKVEKLPEYEEKIKALENATPQFANDKIKHWNELAKKGVNFDRDFFALQDMDVDKMKNPFEVLVEAKKRSGETLSDDLIALKMKRKYNVDEWMDKDVDDYTDDDKLNKAEFDNEVNQSREFLKKYKSERAFLPPVDEAAEKAMAKQREKQRDEWNAFIDKEVGGKIKPFEVESEGVKFEYKFSDDDKNEMVNVMKNLPENINGYFSKYLTKDEKGEYIPNHFGVGSDRLKAANFDKAVKAALEFGIAQGKFLKEKSEKSIQAPVNGGQASEQKVFNTQYEALRDKVRELNIR